MKSISENMGGRRRMFARIRRPYPASLTLALIAMNAAAYAAVGLIFNYVVPILVVGIVRFWPPVIVPAVFAVVFGPWIGGLGAAIGIFIGDMLIHGMALLSITVGVPANFIMFSIIGLFTTEKLDMIRYEFGAVLGNALGCLWIGLTYWAYVQYLAALPGIEKGASILAGVNFAWPIFLAQLPFVVVAVPPIVYAVKRVYPDLMIQQRVKR